MKVSKRSFKTHRRNHQSSLFGRTKACLFATFAFVMYCLVCFQKKLLLRDNQSPHYARCGILLTMDKSQIAKLEEIDLKDCHLQEVPSNIQYATRLKKLDVSNNKDLSTLPDELEFCKELDILFASNCPSMKALPSVLGKTNIRRLGWRSGSLTVLDPNGIPPHLVHLILTNNSIETIDDPELFKKLRYVRKLMLSHNKISRFGGEDSSGLEELTSLELLRLSGNNLNEIPSRIWQLPKLSWLTISGNPVVDQFNKKQREASEVPSITWKDLTSLGKDLGEGASGKVGLYEWQEKQVAVKIIHGVTSDGKAEDELSIYNAVGSSGVENRVVGCIALLDEERKGIVMEPLPKDMDDFALAPSIVTVTEDRWQKHLTLSASFVINVLNDAASALSFIHSKGISHGDFYAHNVKVDKDTGRLFLLDFGASFFKGFFSKQAELIEVRSYGVLVGEMIERLDKKEKQLNAKLQTLYTECTNPIVAERPMFNSIKNTVQNLSIK